MKSIANQYRDLKEGKMSQANFMRNLRMSMPQVTNTMSFGDAVKILKNKGIITENMVKANYEDPITLAKAVADAHPELQRFALEDRKMFQRAAFKYAAELMKSADLSDRVQMNLINGYADEDWPSDFISALGSALESSAVSENNDPEVKTNNEDAEFDAMLKQLEDEMGGEEAVKGQYDLEEGPEEEVEKAIQAKKIDPAVVKTAAEKAIRGDSTDLALLMVNAGNLNEAKEKTNPNKVHPQEYTMGIRYELKGAKGDIVKAERAVLKNLTKEPFYYTALKLSGKDIYKEAPSVKAEVPKKKSKKKEAELVDTINAMQKVKMPKADGKKKIKENLEEVDPKTPAINTPDEKNIEKLLPTYTTLINALKRENTIAELDGLFEIFLNATTLKAISKSAIIGALRSVLDRTQGSTFTSKLANKPAAPVTPITPSSTVSSKIFGGPNTGGPSRGIKEVDTPQDDRVEAELASALSQQPTLKRILQKVDLPQEVNGTIKALLDRTNLKNIPDAIILAALRKVLNDTPGSSFTAQYAINKNIGKPLPDLKEKLTSIVREMLAEKEEAPSKKKAAEEITAKAVDYIDDYNEGEKTYKKSQLENVFDSYEDKVGHRFDDSVFEDVIDMLKVKGYTMTMKEIFDGRDNLTNISDDTK